MSLKQIAINTAIVLGTLALAFLLWEFREAVILFIFSLAVAAAARPYVESLVNRGAPRALAIVLVYVLFLALIALIMWAIGSSFLNEIQHLFDNLVATYEQIWNSWPKGSQIQQFIIHQLPPPADLYKGMTPERASSTLKSLLGFTMTSATLLGQFFTVLMLSIYWSIDRVHFERVWLSLLPVNSRARSRDIWRNIEHDFGAYIRSEVMQSLLAGLLLGLGLHAIGIPYPTLLAVFGALAWFIPWIGGMLAVLPIALVGLSQSIGMGIFATVYALGVLFFLEFYIEPRFIHRRRQQFSSLLSILLIIALVQPFGLMGFLVAPPLAAAIELIFRYNLRTRPLPESVQSAEQISILRGRIIQIREMLMRTSEQVEPQTSSLLDRLETLVDQSDRAIRQTEASPTAQPMRRATDQLPAARPRR
jgi:predicted PurR-regulated permease PerM